MTEQPHGSAVMPGDEEGEFYIRTPELPADDRHLVLKQDDTFAVLDRHGDIRPVGLAEEGLFHRGTRFLSRLELSIGGQRALLLSSAVKRDNAIVSVDLTNLDITRRDSTIARGTLHLSRTIALWDSTYYERVTVRNFGASAVATTIAIVFDADYADIFEVRGAQRPRRGERLDPEYDGGGVVLRYRGLDRVTRRTRIAITPAPVTMTASEARLAVALEPRAEMTFDLRFSCEIDDDRPSAVTFPAAAGAWISMLAQRRNACCEIDTPNAEFNEWFQRSVADLAMMATDTEFGPLPYAGVPWFSTPFGRDSIITSLECLWAMPAMARGVLGYLAATQAVETDPERDAQPGKILHEARDGEMGALNEIPFRRYYGSHDATPLFVMLASAYFDRTGDQAFIERIWPNIEAALGWIERDGDLDGDGFVEYARQSPRGLLHQGWKDSQDSVFHRDGRAAEGPIALCEIQGYVYAAWRSASRLARATRRQPLATVLASKAERLRGNFERAFWCREIGTYALALDGAKQPCVVTASNAGHALYTGIASKARATQVARSLLAAESFSGWGIRTIATTEARFNPMSYHNGSVWPHDNALIAAGLARYDLRREALRITEGMFEASRTMDLHRLPEVFCGFERRSGENPTLYPVACSPQAWAAAAVFLCLQSVLGLEVNAAQRLVRFRRSVLPAFLPELRIRNLAVGDVAVDLDLRRHDQDVSINVLRRTGDVEIVATK